MATYGYYGDWFKPATPYREHDGREAPTIGPATGRGIPMPSSPEERRQALMEAVDVGSMAHDRKAARESVWHDASSPWWAKAAAFADVALDAMEHMAPRPGPSAATPYAASGLRPYFRRQVVEPVGLTGKPTGARGAAAGYVAEKTESGFTEASGRAAMETRQDAKGGDAGDGWRDDYLDDLDHPDGGDGGFAENEALAEWMAAYSTRRA